MNAPHISLVFVNYGSVEYLANALKSLFACEKNTDFFEVIVVNNDASERQALVNLQKTFLFQLVESGENIGFGRGNNLGAKMARGKILGFINPDVIWVKECSTEIERAFSSDTKLGILGMALLDEKKKPEAWSFGKEPSIANLFYNNFSPLQTFGKEEKISSQNWVSGGAMFIPAKLFSAIGGFDERFFLYFEDVDLCASARKRGFPVKRYADLPLVHLGSKSQISATAQKKHFLESQRKYFEKWRPKWESSVLNCLQFLFSRKIN